MLKNIGLLVSLLFLILSVVCIFNARGVVGKKCDNEHINQVVKRVKIVGYIVAVLSLIAIYFI